MDPVPDVKPALTLECPSPTVEAAAKLADVVQQATDHVEQLVEKASELLGESLDHSSLHKLAQMSKEMGIEKEEALPDGGRGGEDREEEGSESHVSTAHYVTAPSSPIIHISALAMAEEINTTSTANSSRRSSSRDGTPAMGRKLRFTTITGEVESQRRGRSRLEVDAKDLGSARSDPGTPNLSET